MNASEYWTVGEFARRCGVSIRTVQYYDQKQLLAPSAKGPQNRRLYSQENERELQRILVLKFLGNTLADIRDILDVTTEASEATRLERLIDEQAHEVGRNLTRLMNRAVTLRNLKTLIAEGQSVDWNEIIEMIGNGQSTDEIVLFDTMPVTMQGAPAMSQGPAGQAHPQRRNASARANGSQTPEESGASPAEQPPRPAITPWHETAAETIGLLAAGVPCDDPWAKEVTRRYLDLCEEEGRKRLLSEFIPFGRMQNRVGNGELIDRVRRSVDDYIAYAQACMEDSRTTHSEE